MANFPTSLDDGTSLPNPGANAFTNNPSHAGLHDTANDAIKAIETKIGIGSSTPTAGKVFRGTGTGTSSWAQVVLTTDVTGTLPVANGGTGVASLGSGIVTFLGTPTSANLLAAVTDETGSGSLVFATSPTLTSPTLTTPTIASFTNAQHDHSNAANGGGLGTAVVGTTQLANASVTPGKLATGAATAFVSTGETTTSTSFVQLTTTTDAVTVTIGANGLALVSFSCFTTNNGNGNISYASFAVSGSTTIAAGTPASGTPGNILAQNEAGSNNVNRILTYTGLVTGLTAGSNTFSMKYKASAGTSNFTERRISVVPL